MSYAIASHRRRTPALPRLGLMLSHMRERAALSRLDAARLADLGITATEAHVETLRAPWDVSPHRR